MRRILAGGLGLSLLLPGAGAWAQELLRPTVADPPPAAAGASLATLGRPVALDRPEVREALLRPISYSTPDPLSPAPVARGQMPEAPPAPAGTPLAPLNPGPPAAAPLNPGPPPGLLTNPSAPYNGGVIAHQEPSPGPPFLDRCRQFLGLGGESFDSNNHHHLFESDHAFDGFISPVTNPFYFEDPRALTEVRPVFIYEQSPTRNPIYHGGDIEFFGVQARVAVTDQLSFVLNKFGWTWMEPHDAVGDFQVHSGFSEIWLGPKYTFLRCENTGTVGAVGLTFEIPVGESRVLQDTGSLALVPYLSLGQSFLRSSYGTFNALGTLGYNFSVDRERSEDLFTSLHLDYDVLNLHKIYPLIELNWFHYTRNGTSEPVAFEGADLFNFGSRFVAGHNDLSLALGARYKVNECLQFGGAVEFPLTNGSRELMDYRITLDVIFRF